MKMLGALVQRTGEELLTQAKFRLGRQPTFFATDSPFPARDTYELMKLTIEEIGAAGMP